MKLKITLLALLFIGIGQQAEAQLLKKLKKKAEEAAERILMKKTEEKAERLTEAAFDSVANLPNKKLKKRDQKTEPKLKESEDNALNNTAYNNNTVAKKSLYPKDVILETFENDLPGTFMYFDTDALAMRNEVQTEVKGYIDSDGFQYIFNDSKQKWEKTGIMNNDAVSFMLPMATVSYIKMPAGATLEYTRELKANGLNPNTFQLIEWAFIYNPDHFRENGFTESTVPCENGECLKFTYTDPSMKDSYVLFDDQRRLSKVHAIVTLPDGQVKVGDYNFSYQDVEVILPNAEEVKIPFQDVLMDGLNVRNSEDVNSESAPQNTDGAYEPGSPKGGLPSRTSASGPNEVNDRTSGETPSSSSDNPKQPETDTYQTLPRPDVVFSYVGVTVDLYSEGHHHTYRLDTKNWVQEIDYNGYENLKPTYFDLGGTVYTHIPEEDRYVCANMKMLGKAFGKMFGKALEKGEMGISKKDIANFIEENKEVIEIIMDLYKNAPTDLQNAALFPIGNWAYIYGLFRVAIFENNNYQKTEDGPFISYNPVGDTTKSIHYDEFGRPQLIEAIDGYVEFSYEEHNLIPPFCTQSLGGF